VPEALVPIVPEALVPIVPEALAISPIAGIAGDGEVSISRAALTDTEKTPEAQPRTSFKSRGPGYKSMRIMAQNRDKTFRDVLPAGREPVSRCWADTGGFSNRHFVNL